VLKKQRAKVQGQNAEKVRPTITRGFCSTQKSDNLVESTEDGGKTKKPKGLRGKTEMKKKGKEMVKNEKGAWWGQGGKS